MIGGVSVDMIRKFMVTVVMVIDNRIWILIIMRMNMIGFYDYLTNCSVVMVLWFWLLVCWCCLWIPLAVDGW